MGDPTQELHAYRVVRITEDDSQTPAQLERLLQRLYMIAEPIVDLTGLDAVGSDLVLQLKRINRYQTSKGGERLRIVSNSSGVRRQLGDPASVFRVYATVKEALTTT